MKNGIIQEVIQEIWMVSIDLSENAGVVPDVTDEIIISLNSGSECDGQSDSKSSSPSNQEPD
jgi:hypothetical protein